MAQPNSTTKKDDLKHKAEDLAGTGMEKAKDFASSAMEKARDAASAVGQRADDATSSVGGGMRSLAGSIRENAPREGMLGSASSAVASTLDKSGKYLQKEGLSGMAEDMTDIIRRNPIPAVLIGVGIGFLLARLTTSSRS